ncbi:probable aminoacyl tRNA synthase complex-interacting multifunctional protein 2 isoform X2 [Hylaeus volcanicus]|uniref:probable aminoacyl tRNA synthase complex-interacting multifunctional protein 2 isoform X2 n=1 Tax=Hylaeus volcanicus TaxID=313075 RepID=UPI0023B87ADC|nr:probable aminoacyl tRNA synthase complex-interacting multifunctional protein 2 isoform X2 [Hylaeus volcanicus]
MTMYAMKPIVSLPRMSHRSKPMYEMRNIHEERSRDDHTEAVNETVPDITEQSPLPEYNALEARQEKILAQLAELRKQVSTLSSLLKQTNQAVTVDKCHKTQDPVSINLIVNVNPKRPPYFISALQKVWKDTDITVQTYVHSSIGGDVPTVHQETKGSPRNNLVNLSLIWKDVEDLEFVTGLYGYRITGETNLLRYISRLLSSHNYENSSLNVVNTIDLILDLCYSIHFQQSLKKKQEILSLIADKLDRNWSSEGKPDIADIAVWCTIKQVFPKQCPPVLKKWFEACEKHFV